MSTVTGILALIPENNDRVQARVKGVHDALAERAIAVQPRHQVEGLWGIAEGKHLARLVLSQEPLPTALICGNGYLAVGAMLECQRHGIRVPEDISIVGYDDFEIMAELPVSITTVRTSGEDVGRRCARILMAQLAGEPHEIPHECSAELLIRGSSGPPRRRKLKPVALEASDTEPRSARLFPFS